MKGPTCGECEISGRDCSFKSLSTATTVLDRVSGVSMKEASVSDLDSAKSVSSPETLTEETARISIQSPVGDGLHI